MLVTTLTYCYTAVTIILLYIFLKKSLETRLVLRKSILWWMLFGFLFNLFSFTWLYAAYPLMWMPEGLTQIMGIVTLHLTLSFVASVGYGCVGWFLYIQNSKKLFRPFLFAISLVVAEMVRSLAISTLFKGGEGTIEFHYTSSTLGNALSTTPFVEFAYFGGTFALTYILAYFIYCCVTPQHIKTYWTHILTLCSIFVIVHFCIPVHGPQKQTKVGVITTHFMSVPDDQILSSFQKQNMTLNTMTHSFIGSEPDIIVYPEDARYIEYLSQKNRDDLYTYFPQTLFIDGNTNIYQGKMVNVSLFYYPDTGKMLARGKSFLLPFNEFIPLFFRPIFSLFMPQEEMDEYTANHTYTPIYSQKTVVHRGMKIGTLLCSEILSLSTINDLKKEDPSIVFFQSRLNVFHDNPIAWAMLHSSVKIAAAQLRRPVVSSINGAPSFVVSAHGSMLAHIPTGFSTSTFIFSR